MSDDNDDLVIKVDGVNVPRWIGDVQNGETMTDEPYDSTADTMKHIEQVQSLLLDMANELVRRAGRHDASKLRDPEKSMLDKFTPMLRSLTYGSPEYKQCLVDMGAGLQHHYENNTHHPEHFKMWRCNVCQSVFCDADAPALTVLVGNPRLCQKCVPQQQGTIMECILEPASGIYGMSLLDVLEMFIDWRAAVMRHADGDFQKSLEINKERFKISDQLSMILQNTAKEMGW